MKYIEERWKDKGKGKERVEGESEQRKSQIEYTSLERKDERKEKGGWRERRKEV